MDGIKLITWLLIGGVLILVGVYGGDSLPPWQVLTAIYIPICLLANTIINRWGEKNKE